MENGDDLTLIEIVQRFPDADSAGEYLESLRWPNGPVCPHCGEAERKAYRLKTKTARRLWKCAACRKQYTVTVGTIFEDSHVPLHKWLWAFYLLCASKKGMSAHQLHRMLKVQYKTAWFMAHRIRYAMDQAPFRDRLIGTVEADETYIGGKPRRANRRIDDPPGWVRKTGRGTDKTPVLVLVERGGYARSFRVANVTGETLGAVIRRNIDPSADLRTDSYGSYKRVGWEFASHETVNHLDEYVRGDAHTNTAENYFSILKRGIDGVYHHVSEAHLPRYLSEFDFRYNTRTKNGYSDGDRTVKALSQVAGKRLRYSETRGNG